MRGPQAVGMRHLLRPFWCTLQLSPQRTQDIRLQAHGEWSAWWLAGQLYPCPVICVRPIGGGE